jgi:hypothetical protein
MKRLFAAGDPVICINDAFPYARKHYPGLNYPVFGSRYIVRGYVADGKYPAIIVREISNPSIMYFDGDTKEAGFWDRRFVKAAPPVEIKVSTKREKEAV